MGEFKRVPHAIVSRSDKHFCVMLHPITNASGTERVAEEQHMKKLIWTVGGVCAAAAGFLVWHRTRLQPVQLLAEQLEHAWADHHTRA